MECIYCNETLDTTGVFDEAIGTDYGMAHRDCYDGYTAGE